MPFDVDLTTDPLPPVIPQDRSDVAQLRRDMLLEHSEGAALDVIGNRYGVPRPPQSDDDELYRRLIQLLAWLPKTLLSTTYWLMDIVLGTQASIRQDGLRPWRIYEVNPNEIIIELPLHLIAATNENASYMHGWSGYGFVASGPTDTFTTPGDVRVASATTLVGKTLVFNTASGTWTEYTISAATYSAVTGVTTIQVSAATLPTGGGLFYVDVPGDNTASYRGDFLASSGFVSVFSTAAGPPTDTLSVRGDATKDVVVGDTVQLHYGGSIHSYTVNTRTYDATTNITTVVVNAATVTGGLIGQVIVRIPEIADGSDVSHADRVYLTGLGSFEIVQFYLDLLVRAAGIVVRVELI